MCSGLARSARIPPWMVGWRVLTLPPSISGAPVRSATSTWAIPAAASASEVPPLETSSHPRSDRPRARSSTPVLSYTDSNALIRPPPTLILVHGPGRPPARPGSDGWLWVEGAFHLLDPLVQAVRRVGRQNGDGPLGQDRAGVHLHGGEVHGGAGLGHAGGQGLLHRMPTGESGQQGGVGVQDAPGIAGVDGLGQDRPESGHDHDVDLMLQQPVTPSV